MKEPIPEWLEKEVAEYDLDITPPPATILDIGANIGAFTLHYARKWPHARIEAIEPVTENFRRLKENTDGLHRLRLMQAAVRRFGGWAAIYKGDNFATHSFYQLSRQTQRTEEVPCLAAHLLDPAELVKIDTEGCELEILSNLRLDKTRAVVVEYHSPADGLGIKAFLEEQNFRLLEHRPGSVNHGVMKFAKGNGVTLPSAECGVRSAEVKSAPTAPRKIFLATAAHFSNFDVAFVQSLLTVALRPRVAMELAQPNTDPSVERARNILTANFLATDCTHILFIDADIIFTPEDVARISSHDEPIVGGLYPLKHPSPEVQWCGNGKAPGEAAIRPDGLSLVKYIGTGFLCVRRDVFERMIAVDGPDIAYKQDFPPYRQEYAFWRQGVSQTCGQPSRFLTEDWMFCQRWNELGGEIYADSQVVLRHVGRTVYPLPLQTGNPFAPPTPSPIS